jgi:hypothetical protein
VASVLAAAAMPATPAAHRLDEYLQASRVSVARDRIALEVDLTPGANIASDVIASLDRDGDATISPIEAQSYGQSVLADLAVELDGRPVSPTLTRVEISTIAELREGMGAIRLQATATIDGSVAGGRNLHLRNHHQPEKSVYLANALVPDTADVRIVSQVRDSRQRDLRIEYTVEPRWPVKLVWLLAGFSVLAGLLVQRRGRRKGLPPPMDPPPASGTLGNDQWYVERHDPPDCAAVLHHGHANDPHLLQGQAWLRVSRHLAGPTGLRHRRARSAPNPLSLRRIDCATPGQIRRRAPRRLPVH